MKMKPTKAFYLELSSFALIHKDCKRRYHIPASGYGTKSVLKLFSFAEVLTDRSIPFSQSISSGADLTP